MLPKLHIICERDVGLFSLIQQVIANIPWALQAGYVPVVYFTDRTCYWRPEGYRGADTVWEYYFEPLVKQYPAAIIPEHIRRLIASNPPVIDERGDRQTVGAEALGYAVDDHTFISAQYGDHPLLERKALGIPYLRDDPDRELRKKASRIIASFIRPREYLRAKVEAFFASHMQRRNLIGVHVRGTDAVSPREGRQYRRGSLVLQRYSEVVRHLLETRNDAKIFVATDDEASLGFFKDNFGDRVIAYDCLRHSSGEPAGQGPLGCLMPAYVAADRNRAARNGEEAVIEYLLLSRCHYLVHNGASLARTVLLKEPALPQTNTHKQN